MLKKEDLQVADEIFCQLIEKGETDILDHLVQRYGDRAMIMRIFESLCECNAARMAKSDFVYLNATDHTPVVKANGGVDWIYKQEQESLRKEKLRDEQLKEDVRRLKRERWVYKASSALLFLSILEIILQIFQLVKNS